MAEPDDLSRERRLAFGANLRAIRTQAGLSQGRLGQAGHLERAYVGHIENGRRNVSLQTMWHLADALGVSPDRFFDGQSPAAPAHADARAD